MGGGSGGSYSSSPSTLSSNVQGLASKYPLDSSGKFGYKTQDNVQNLAVSDPGQVAKDFFSALSDGGTVSDLKNGKGKIATFGSSESAFVVYRPTSKSDGSPAISLKIPGKTPLDYKIHFVKEN